MKKEYYTLLQTWRERALRNASQHYDAGDLVSWWDTVLGVFNITATIAVVSFGIAFWWNKSNQIWPIIFGASGVILAITGVLQVLYNGKARAVEHRYAGMSYGTITRHLEQILSANGKISRAEVVAIRHSLDVIAASSPVLPKRIFRNAHYQDVTQKILELETQQGELPAKPPGE